jgi:hypothetical protein
LLPSSLSSLLWVSRTSYPSSVSPLDNKPLYPVSLIQALNNIKADPYHSFVYTFALRAENMHYQFTNVVIKFSANITGLICIHLYLYFMFDRATQAQRGNIKLYLTWSRSDILVRGTQGGSRT